MDREPAVQTPPTTAFDRATAVEPAGEGRFTSEVDPGWGAPTGPNGGYLAATVARAMQAHADPAGERQLRSLTTHYLRPAHGGPIDLQVETLRSGRRFSTVRLTGSQEGRQVLTALGALSLRGMPTAAEWAPRPPEVSPAPPRGAPRRPPTEYAPDAWIAATDQMPPIVHRVDIAPRLGSVPFSGAALEPGEAAETGGWIELPEPRAIDPVYLALLTDVWWPPSFGPLSAPAIAPTIDLTIHIRADLPPEGLPDQPVLGRYRTAAAADGTIEEDGELFLADGTLLAQSRQLALLAPLG